ncbi:MAG: hypothetical protein M1817_002964 [Caeruleum heppii]|nr:MAG: hypothetical protein M1817_002964 [Caeruleum heppii]
MRQSQLLILWSSLIASAVAAESPRPRGVGPDFAKFYRSSDKFECISAPSIHMPISRINDDYCDCPDGSDEPGTSACSHISNLSPPASPPSSEAAKFANSTLALPGYYCKNKGHQPSYIPFTYVNDGTCDYELCCDGSDEWDGVGGLVCEDKCKEIGKEWRKNDEARKRAMSVAAKKRKELVVEAQRLKREVEDRIGTLETEIEGQEKKVQGLDRELSEVQRRERGRIVKGPGKGGRINVLAELAKRRIEELRESVIAMRDDRNAARSRIKELEGILYTFKEEYNPNFNDEGVKRAVRSWEEYAARKEPSEDDEVAAEERDLDEIVKPDGPEGGIKWEEFEGGEEESDVDILYKLEAYLPSSVRNWLDARIHDLRQLLIENGILADTSSSATTESPAVVTARQALEAAQQSLETSRSGLTSHREDLVRDYGKDEVFRSMKGRCIEKDSGEYVYELCWMTTTKQKPKKGGADTGLGSFQHFDTVIVDEDPSLASQSGSTGGGGGGGGTVERLALRYENGQQCWNGPQRSTTVVLVCSGADEILKVFEEEKCVYRMDAGTPAVCEGSQGGGAGMAAVKDEL